MTSFMVTQAHLAVMEKKENTEAPKESLTAPWGICRYFYKNTCPQQQTFLTTLFKSEKQSREQTAQPLACE